jgi:hypothetical protein
VCGQNGWLTLGNTTRLSLWSQNQSLRTPQNENLGNYSTDSARWNAVRREWAQGEQAARRVTIVEIKRERSSQSAPCLFSPSWSDQAIRRAARVVLGALSQAPVVGSDFAVTVASEVAAE